MITAAIAITAINKAVTIFIAICADIILVLAFARLLMEDD
jgi:hypothetical protein